MSGDSTWGVRQPPSHVFLQFWAQLWRMKACIVYGIVRQCFIDIFIVRSQCIFFRDYMFF